MLVWLADRAQPSQATLRAEQVQQSASLKSDAEKQIQDIRKDFSGEDQLLDFEEAFLVKLQLDVSA